AGVASANVSELTNGGLQAMFWTKWKMPLLLLAVMAMSGSGWLLHQALADKPGQAAAQGPEKPSGGPATAEKVWEKTEAQVAQIGELVKPKPEEPRANMARITSWQTNAWEAATKAAREGKPIIVFGGHAGVSAGFC